MLIQLISLIILTIFSLLNILFIFCFVALVILFILLKQSLFISNLGLILWLILATGIFFIIAIYLYEILQFYTSFRFKKRLSVLVDYKSTKYVEVLDIFLQDLQSHAQIDVNWFQIYALNDEKIKIYSFANFRQGVLVLSFGALDEIIRLIKKDKLKALESFEFVMGHEISHLQNEHFIAADFFKTNFSFTSWMKSVVLMPLVVLQKIINFIPFFGKFFGLILIFAGEVINSLLSISGNLLSWVYKFLRRTLLQFQETRADRDSVSIFGHEAIESFLDFFPQYSNAFSVHTIKYNIRLNNANTKMHANTKFNFAEDSKDILLTLYSIIGLIASCLLSIVIVKIFYYDLTEFFNLIKIGYFNIAIKVQQAFYFFKEYFLIIKKIFI